MNNKITYYAVIDGNVTTDQPLGLVRRLEQDNGPVDEALKRDMSWRWTPVIVEWEHDSFDDELVEVSHAQASKIIQYFRAKFAADG